MIDFNFSISNKLKSDPHPSKNFALLASMKAH